MKKLALTIMLTLILMTPSFTTRFLVPAKDHDGAYCVMPMERSAVYPKVHNLNTKLNYTTIQEAINAPETQNGHTILAEQGIYNENVVINKTLEVIGENRHTTIIDGKGLDFTVAVVANGVTIRNFTLQNGSTFYPGGSIYVYSKKTTIFDNIIRDGACGVYLYNSNNITVSNNEVSNGKFGIWLDHDSTYNDIIGNIILSNSQYGIYAGVFSNSNRIIANTFSRNNYGIGFSDTSDNLVLHNNFADNTHQFLTYTSINNWNNTQGGNYWSEYNGTDLNHGPYQNETGSDGIGDAPYIIDENNRDNYPLMKPYAGLYDIGITSITTSKAVVGQSHNLTIIVKILNYGVNTEIFNLTVYANNTAMQTIENIVLTSRNSATITLTWNTTGFVMGNYSISAYAWPVLGEIDIADNTRCRAVYISILGDINGDTWVNVEDAAILGAAFNSHVGQLSYNPNADINDDEYVNAKDAIILGVHFNNG